MIKRCTDLRRIKRLAPEWDLIFSHRIYYLVEEKDGEDLGVIVFVPVNGILMIHVELGKKCRGKQAVKICMDAFNWVFQNTDCEDIIAEIPLHNRPAHFVARHAGMDFEGIVEKALRCYSLTKQMFMAKEGYV